jgi:hypothetical protein
MPTPPPFQEALISQIPALRTLQQIGFTYLSPEEYDVERHGHLGRVILAKVLAGQLRRLNKISLGREVAFSEENIARGFEALRDLPFEGLVRTSEKVYDLLTQRKSFYQTIEGETKEFTVCYLDFILGLNKNDGGDAIMGTPLRFWAKWRTIPDTKETKVIRVHPVGTQDGVVCRLLMNLEVMRAGYPPTVMTEDPQPPGLQLLGAFTDELSRIVKQGFRRCFHSLGLA